MESTTITITASFSVENHVGNQIIGDIEDTGISQHDMNMYAKNMDKYDLDYTIYDLEKIAGIEGSNPDACYKVLVCRNFYNKHADKLFNELVDLKWDDKYYDVRRKRVLNKRARTNLCFADFRQQPDYENGKGRVYKIDDLPALNKYRRDLFTLTGNEYNFEGNNYGEKGYIGEHGDKERSTVVGLRLGKSMNLTYRWFHQCQAISDFMVINLHHGDLYMMGNGAVGSDWKRRSLITLRHAANIEV